MIGTHWGTTHIKCESQILLAFPINLHKEWEEMNETYGSVWHPSTFSKLKYKKNLGLLSTEIGSEQMF